MVIHRKIKCMHISKAALPQAWFQVRALAAGRYKPPVQELCKHKFDLHLTTFNVSSRTLQMVRQSGAPVASR